MADGPGPNQRVEYKAGLKSAIPSERAMAATHAMRNALNFSDAKCANDIFKAFNRENDPRVAAVLVGAYAVAAKKMNLKGAFENLVSLLSDGELAVRFEQKKIILIEGSIGTISSFDEAILSFDKAIIDAFTEVSPSNTKMKAKDRKFRDLSGLHVIASFGAATNNGQLKLHCIDTLGFITVPAGDVGVTPDELVFRINAISEIMEGKLPAGSEGKIKEKGRLAIESLEQFQNDRALPLPLYRAIWYAERVEKLAGEIKGF